AAPLVHADRRREADRDVAARVAEAGDERAAVAVGLGAVAAQRDREVEVAETSRREVAAGDPVLRVAATPALRGIALEEPDPVRAPVRLDERERGAFDVRRGLDGVGEDARALERVARLARRTLEEASGALERRALVPAEARLVAVVLGPVGAD